MWKNLKWYVSKYIPVRAVIQGQWYNGKSSKASPKYFSWIGSFLFSTILDPKDNIWSRLWASQFAGARLGHFGAQPARERHFLYRWSMPETFDTKFFNSLKYEVVSVGPPRVPPGPRLQKLLSVLHFWFANDNVGFLGPMNFVSSLIFLPFASYVTYAGYAGGRRADCSVKSLSSILIFLQWSPSLSTAECGSMQSARLVRIFVFNK